MPSSPIRLSCVPDWATLPSFITIIWSAFRGVKWSTQGKNAVVVTLFDRKILHPDVDRLVGDFTSTGVVVLEQADQPLEKLAQQAFSELMAVVKHGSYSGVSVLRVLPKSKGASPPNTFSSLPLPYHLGGKASSSTTGPLPMEPLKLLR